MSRIIVIEDSIFMSRIYCRQLNNAGYETLSATSVKTAKEVLGKAKEDDIILADYELGDGTCIDVLDWMKSNGYEQPVIVMTQHNQFEYGARAMQHGASRCFLKVMLDDVLVKTIKEMESLHQQKVKLSNNIWTRKGAAFAKVYKNANTLAKTTLSVLIVGESGTGKEHIAHMIHSRSKRADKPWVPVDCASFTDEMAEDAFFGHVKGAFTNAVETKPGYLEAANGGTLYLDEVGNLSVRVQQMLLRVIQEKSYRPVGSTELKKFDIRFVFATNENLQDAVAEGRVRQDFLFRIKEFQIDIPPLRDTKEDILPLAKFILERSNAINGKEIKGFDSSAVAALLKHWWPGNVRELAAVIRAAVPFCEDEYLTASDLSIDETLIPETKGENGMTYEEAKEEFERRIFMKVLRRTNGCAVRSYQILDMKKSTFYDKIKKLGLTAYLTK